jgi:hypothetical protein
MATQVLVDRHVEAGARLLAELDALGFDVPVALWQYSSDWGEWRLVLATPRVDSLGSRDVYGQIIGLLRRKPEIGLQSDQISVVGLSDKRVQALRQTYHRPKGGEGIWLGRSGAHGVYFEDAYLYRSC